MTVTLSNPTTSPASQRVARPRTYLMCVPRHFSVSYAINPWMDPAAGADRDVAIAQWQQLADTYRMLGHTVLEIEPGPGLPDMVFAANGAFVADGVVLSSQFRHPQRQPEAARFARWFAERGIAVHPVSATAEGEGDLVWADGTLFAGHGFRTDVAIHQQVAELLERPVISLELVDPAFYHLDVALCVLDQWTAAYYPGAFTADGRARLAAHFDTLLAVGEADARVLGLNAVSDGRHVVLPRQAHSLALQLDDLGFVPVPVELGELRKAGGGPKCCTLELRGLEPRIS